MNPIPESRASQATAKISLASLLFVTPCYAPFVSGTATLAEAMARRLVGDRHRVTVLTTGARKQTDFWEKPDPKEPTLPLRQVVDGIQVVRLPLAYPRPAPYAFGALRRAGHWLHRSRLPGAVQRPMLRCLARQMPPLPGLRAALDQMVPEADLVQVLESSWDGLFIETVAAARRSGKPCVVAPLMHLGNTGIRAAYQMGHQVTAYRNASAVLALSPSEARAYATLSVPPSRIHGIAMGIDPDAQAGGRPWVADAFRRSHHLTRPTLAFLGANTYDKGAFTLALAVAELAQAGLDLDAIFAGPLSELLAAFVRRQNPTVRSALEGKLHILGAVDEQTKDAMLEACDLLALPSQVDSFGIVILEAWMHGKPVIGALAGGIPDLVRPEETGLLAPFGDVPALAADIRRLVTEPGLAARLGDAGRREVLEHYTWDHTYQTLLRVYAGLLVASGPASLGE
jgi:glycosyltransferase involved in cell wall biosynthesis